MEEQNGTALAEKAMLVNLEVGSWTARAVDEEVTAEVGRTHEATKGHGKYQKNLLSNKALKQVASIRQAARLYHAGMTLPWQGSFRLLPVILYESYRKTMDNFEEQRIKAREDLINNFEAWKNEARDRLGTMFQEDDYPEADELREAFYMTVEFSPVPDVRHFVADLAEAERERVAEKIQEQIEERIAASTRDLNRRMLELAEKTADSLRRGRFSTALYERLQNLAEIMPSLNIRGDQELANLTGKLSEAIAAVDPKELRERDRKFDEEKHDRFQDTISDVQRKLAGYFAEPPEVAN